MKLIQLFIYCIPTSLKIEETLQSPPASLAEARFALGQKIKFSETDLYDLELIPSVSDKLGLNLLEARKAILQAQKSKSSASNTNFSPFELAHGVGQKTGKKLERYLEVR